MIAIIALLPAIKRQEIALKLRILDWFVIICAILFIHYAVFFQLFLFWGLSPKLNIHRYGLSPSILSYVVLVISVIFILIRISFYRLKSSQISKFKSLIDNLISRRMYSEVYIILEDNINAVFSCANKEYSMGKLYSKIKRRTENYYPIDFFFAERNGKKLRNPNYFMKLIFRIILLIMPNYERRTSDANYLLRTIMLKKDLVIYFVSNAPYLGMRLLQYKSYFLDAYVDEYFKSLIQQKSSILYFELKNNQNTNEYAYQIDPHNILLSYLFNPASRAEQLGVWRPIGEYIIQHLDELNNSSTDKYLIQNENYYEDGKWESSLYVGIFFFDVMIKSALKQNIEWHMWLYYYDYFVDRIDRNISRFKKRDTGYYEWDSPYHYLLYTCISNLCDYIRAIEKIPLEQKNVILKSSNLEHENGNIVKSSILCLMICIRKIILSNNISDDFKWYLVKIPFSVLFTLQRSEKLSEYFKCFRNALIAGDFIKNKDDHEYKLELAKYARKIDRVHNNPEEINKFISDLENI